MNIKEVLRRKGTNVIKTDPDRTLREAIQLLVTHGVGALLVVEGEDRIVGIITERDILRASARQPEGLGQILVRELMTRDLLIGLPTDSLEYVEGLMTERRIRHLPIMEQGNLAGIISIGDVVKAMAQAAEVKVRHLTDYITGRYPG